MSDLKSPDDLHELLWSFARARVVTVAARTGILQRLAEAPATADTLASELRLDPVATGKIVRALHATGLLEVVSDGSYRVRPGLAGAFVPGDQDLTGFVEHAHHLYDRWGATLEGWVRSGSVPRTERTEDQQRAFDEGMAANARRLAPKVVAALDRRGARTLLDVGGGLGVFASLFCRAWSGLQATVLDLPDVVARGPAELAGRPEAERVAFVGSDYHQDWPGSYDLVLLSNILHQELPSAASALVARASASLHPGGRLVIVDFAVDDEKRRHELGCMFAINMRGFGDTYSEPEIRGWMGAAGLLDPQRVDITAAQWMIVGRRGDGPRASGR